MKRSSVVSIVLLAVLVVAVGVGGGFGYRTLQDLRAEVTGLRGSVAGLQEDLSESEARAEDARSEAQSAEERASQAEDLSERLAERARLAEEQAQEARSEAATAMSEAESARSEAQTAKSTAAEEAEARRRAEELKREAIVASVKAEQEAFEARERLEQIERQKELELDRLERTLGKIAETRRTALGMVMNLGDSIEFDFDRAELRSENKEILSRIAGVLLTAEGFGIQVYGHTDDVGSVEYNQELSERRAEAVRQYLIGAGVDEAKIQSKGFGKSAPLVEGTDAEARQRNRRVEIAVVQTTGSLPEELIAEEPEDAGAEGDVDQQ